MKTCIDCGIALPEGSHFNTKRCDNCRRINARMGRAARRAKKKELAAEKERKKRSLGEITRAANAAGLSYGQYVARMREQG